MIFTHLGLGKKYTQDCPKPTIAYLGLYFDFRKSKTYATAPSPNSKFFKFYFLLKFPIFYENNFSKLFHSLFFDLEKGKNSRILIGRPAMTSSTK